MGDLIENRAQWAETLTGEALLFELLGRLLYSMPDRALVQTLVDQDVFSEAPFGGGQPQVQEGLELLQSWSASYQHGPVEEVFADLEADYTRLFIGPGKVLAPPWESVFFGEDRMVFQEQTLQVRSWYRRFGLQVEKLHQEPDDHLGLEFFFLAHLVRLGLAALDEGDQAKLETVLNAQAQFIHEHPLKWISLWAENVAGHARTDFYRGAARMAEGALLAASLAATAHLK